MLVHTSSWMNGLSTSWVFILGWFKSLPLEYKLIFSLPILKRFLPMLRLVITTLGLSNGVL
jgi:hypothetical protein